MAQQALGSEDHEGLLDGVPPLPAQQVEVGGRGRRVDDPHVVLGAQGQEALDAGARVLGPLPLVAVGEEQDEAGGLTPLGLGAGQELVDDDLGPVHEVAELGLPHHERAVLGHRVAELEAHDRGLGQKAVVDLEAHAAGGHAVQGDVLPARAHVVEDRVALAEGAAAAVLPGEAHGDPLQEQGAEGEGLRGGPVRLPLAPQQLRALPHEGDELGVDLEALGQRAQDPEDGLEAAPHGRGVHGGGLDGGPLGDPGQGPRLALPLHLRLLVVPELLEVGAGDDPLAQELVAVELGHRGVALDLGVHQGLGVARLVPFVVAPAPVADEVDHHVLLEALAVLEGEAGHVGHRLGIVAVHVDGGGVDHLRHVGAVGRGARVVGQGGEADLVVHHHVDGAAGVVALEAGEVEGLGHDPLAGEGGVPVHEEGDHPRPVPVAQRVLLGPHHALDHGVDELEMAGVGGDAHGQGLPGVRVMGARRPQVVLDVARSLDRVGVHVALELREDLGQRLPHRVREHVQPAPVRHPDHDLVHPLLGRVVQDPVEERDQRLAALQREALVADVLGVQEALEALGLHELLQHAALAGRVQGRVVAGGLHAILEPVLALRVGDVHVLDADGPAVGLAQDLQDLPQGGPVLAGEPVGDELAVEVPQGEAVGRRIEVAVGRALGVQGVEVAHQVAAHPVGVDELQHPGLLLHLLLAAGGAEEAGVLVHLPLDRTVGQAQVLEDPLVEAVLAPEQPLQAGEEEPGLRALDDPVVVGRGHGHDLADPEQAQGAGGHGAVLGRVVEGPGGDDQPLAGHEAGRRGARAHGAGVGQGDRGADEVVGGDRPLAGAAHQIVEGLEKGREVHLPRVLDVRHQEGAGAVLLLHVHRDPQAHHVALDAVGLPLKLRVGVVQAREGVEGSQDGPGHEVGEADLALPERLAVLVQDPPVLLQGANGDRADGGRGGDG